jgi:hypothetical protein
LEDEALLNLHPKEGEAVEEIPEETQEEETPEAIQPEVTQEEETPEATQAEEEETRQQEEDNPPDNRLYVKPAAGLRAHLTEEEGVRSEVCRDMRSDS